SQTFQVGEQIVRVPGVPVRPSPPIPGRPIPGRPGFRSNPYPNTVDRLQIQKKYASISISFIYDLDDPLQPEPYMLLPLETPQVSQLRVSYDGRRITGLAQNHTSTTCTGIDALNPKNEPVKYSLTEALFQPVRGLDLAHHPQLPISVLAASDTIL